MNAKIEMSENKVFDKNWGELVQGGWVSVGNDDFFSHHFYALFVKQELKKERNVSVLQGGWMAIWVSAGN